jgi:putative inorganic carbon (HCO3(-)) transporter
MLRSSWLVLLYLSFLGLGITTPFVLTLGYVWVDTFQPQSVAYFILNELPVAFIMGAAAVLSYFLMDRRSPPPLMLVTVCMIALTIWMTAALLWAELPLRAWAKWDWAFKTMAIAAFIPLVIRSRVQIEAFAQTYVFSLAANFVPFGVKVLVSGGGYGQNLGLQAGNSGLAEGGYLSTVCLMAVPLALFLGKHGQLIPRLPMMNLAYAGVAILAVVTAIGTYERSALVGMVILGLYMFIRSRRKLMFGTLIVVAAVAVVMLSAQSWNARVSTIEQYKTESSALTRLLIWQWTLGFASSHPFGGGFDAYGTSVIMMPPDDLHPGGYIQSGRAYHSIYFEVLGDLGYPGLAMFLVVIGSSLVSLIRLSRKCRNIPDLVWVADMSDAVQSGMLVFLTSGAFVGLAFQPPFWYFVAMGVCLRAHVWHAERAEPEPAKGWRLAAQRVQAANLNSGPGWRKPPAPTAEQPAPARVWRRSAGSRNDVGRSNSSAFIRGSASSGGPGKDFDRG